MKKVSQNPIPEELMEPLFEAVDRILNQDWATEFIYDREEAMNTGAVVVRYEKTRKPIQLKMPISAKAFENLEFGHRELQRKIKELLPLNVISLRISDINNVLRNADRRNFRDVERDYANWMEETSDDINRCYGDSFSISFRKSIPLPSHIRHGSIQALQFLVGEKIELLQEI